jgi:NADPH-dependent 2,4-dienoyl-CoA reductase/sulfur reductase-like enzyme
VIKAGGHVVVVGGSIAGLTAAEELRSQGFEGSVDVLDAEGEKPYARPPLSKAYLSGAEEAADIQLPSFDHLDIAFRPGCAVTALDPERRRVSLGGDEVEYDGLIIASGARAATLDDYSDNSDGVPENVLRTIADADALRQRLRAGGTLLVVGGGILGMEIASTALEAGLSITVVSRGPAMASSLGPFLSTMVTRRALEFGVDFRIVPGGARLEGSAESPRVIAADKVFEADHIVSTVGCVANVDWLAGSGINLSPGVVVDSRCRVSSNIVAAGDVVSLGGKPRSPHWGNALDQARAAVSALLRGDEAEPYRPRPYFWTHQFGMSLKLAGRTPPPSPPTLLAGSETEFAAVWQWLDEGRPVAAAALNRKIPISRLHAHAGQN